jgi:tetratricopeptide (TPR) repeat protein
VAEDLAALLDAEARHPEQPALQRALAVAYRAAGRTADAAAAECAAIALDCRSAPALYNLATVYFRTEAYAPAEKWYRLALAFDPDLVQANQNLAAILEIQGKLAEARWFRDRALRRQCLFVEPVPGATRTVLVLAASAFGNVPVDDLLPGVNRLKWFVEYADPADGSTLPPYDLVFNAIGDADLAEPAFARVRAFLDRCPKPLLNAPERVMQTQRHRMPGLLAGIPQVVVPPVIRVRPPLAGGLAATLRPAGLAAPVLFRPLGSHGGKGVGLVEREDELDCLDPGEDCYLTGFVDYRAADGFYRKYRMIFVDRQPYPYHLAISPHWLVHYFSADMLAEPWKRDEERRFLEDPAAVLGSAGMAAIAEIARRLDLDFAGIDFSILPDGRILVFEANATMRVHLHDRIEDFPYKHIHVPKIFQAFTRMIEERMREG